MKTKIFYLLFVSTLVAYSQVGVNTINPRALLDIEVLDRDNPTNKDGLLVPRVTTLPTVLPIGTTSYSIDMATFYNTTDHLFYYWDGLYNVWKKMTGLDTERLDNLWDAQTSAQSVFLGWSSGNYVIPDPYSVGIGYFATDEPSLYQVGIGWKASGFYSDNTVFAGYLSGESAPPLGGGFIQKNTVAVGYQTLYTTTQTGPLYLQFNDNVAIGSQAMKNYGKLVIRSTAIGYSSAKNITTSSQPTGIGSFGYNSMGLSTGIGSNNIGFGDHSLANINGNSSNNVAFGVKSMDNLLSGNNNAACGNLTLESAAMADRNTAIGSKALQLLQSNSSDNTAIGGSANATTNAWSITVAIGDATVITASNQARFGDSGVNSIGGFTNWTNTSDKKFKKEIKQNVPGISFIKKLRPVSYQLDMNTIAKFLNIKPENRKFVSEERKQSEIQTGFIAQEVEEITTQIGFDFNGIKKPKNNIDYYGLRYASFVVPLTKAIQEQQETLKLQKEKITMLKKKMALLNSLIQEVNSIKIN